MILSMKKMLRKCCLKNAFLSSVHLVDVVVAFHAVALARGQHHVIAVNRTLSLSLSQRKEHLNIFLCKRLCVCVCACSFVLSVSDQMLWKCFTLSECVSYHHIFPFLEGQMRHTHTHRHIYKTFENWWVVVYVFHFSKIHRWIYHQRATKAFFFFLRTSVMSKCCSTFIFQSHLPIHSKRNKQSKAYACFNIHYSLYERQKVR